MEGKNLDTDRLLLGLQSDVERETVGEFPLWVFPVKVQKVIMDLVTYQGFRIEYISTALLSAASTAIGNSCRLSTEGSWVVSASLYFILVGKPGLGKTPPIDVAFKPLRKREAEKIIKYKAERELFKKLKDSDNPPAEPRLRLTLLSDATIESLKQKLEANPNGVCDIYDEIVAWLNSASRNNSSLIEDLLSIYSGTPLVVTRSTMPDPIYVERPCLNIIGTTQTVRFGELIAKGFLDNGLLDRFQFAYPVNQKANHIRKLEDWQTHAIDEAERVWDEVVAKILALIVTDDEGNVISNHLTLTDPARDLFIKWWNEEIVDEFNAIEDEALVKSRTMKRNNNTYRMALVLQIMRHACGEADMAQVDETSVKGAIALDGMYENCYDVILAINSGGKLNETELKIYDKLAKEFTTAEATEECVRAGLSKRATHNYLNRLQAWKLIVKVKHGQYRKV